ncbi:MAG TPA: hypothetical protein P5014_01435 [Patescibacteria group bacterium]|nr:hypothetical protein [bacterium]HRY56805.1 hypothetical protein [Patescibacteria group bacterium]
MPKSVKKYNKLLLVLGVVLFSLVSFSLKNRAYALTQPTKVEIDGEPGKVLTGTLELYNEQEQEITFYLSYQNFEARGEGGSPSFLDYDGTGLASWIKTAQSVTLKPKERIEFPYEIQIPQDMEPGTYLAAIFFGNTPPQAMEGGQVTIGTKLGTLLFLNLPGAKVEGAGVTEFSTEGGNFFSYLPLNLFYRFSNNGALKVMPFGSIDIKCLFGRTVGTLDANISKGNVLPNSVRKFVITWDRLKQDNVNEKEDKTEEVKMEPGQKLSFFDAVKVQIKNFTFGKYTATLNVNYGDNLSATKETSFWVIPWQLLSLVIAALVLIIMIFRGMMKRHNKKLIEMVKKEALTSQQVTIAPTESIVKEEKKTREKVKKEVKEEVEEIKETAEDLKENVEEIKEEVEEKIEEKTEEEKVDNDSETEEKLTALNPKE